MPCTHNKYNLHYFVCHIRDRTDMQDRSSHHTCQLLAVPSLPDKTRGTVHSKCYNIPAEIWKYLYTGYTEYYKHNIAYYKISLYTYYALKLKFQVKQFLLKAVFDDLLLHYIPTKIMESSKHFY